MDTLLMRGEPDPGFLHKFIQLIQRAVQHLFIHGHKISCQVPLIVFQKYPTDASLLSTLPGSKDQIPIVYVFARLLIG